MTAKSLDQAGRVIDFSCIKELVGKRIDDQLDHAFIVNPDDEKMLHFLIDNCQRHFVMPDPMAEPSAENIARLIRVWAEEMLTPKGVKVVGVRFYETPNNYAEETASMPATGSSVDLMRFA